MKKTELIKLVHGLEPHYTLAFLNALLITELYTLYSWYMGY